MSPRIAMRKNWPFHRDVVLAFSTPLYQLEGRIIKISGMKYSSGGIEVWRDKKGVNNYLV
jgi:hypothetical protein